MLGGAAEVNLGVGYVTSCAHTPREPRKRQDIGTPGSGLSELQRAILLATLSPVGGIHVRVTLGVYTGSVTVRLLVCE